MRDAHKRYPFHRGIGPQSLITCVVGVLLFAVCCSALFVSPLYAEEGAQDSSNAIEEQAVPSHPAEGWVKSSHGWWYRYADGTWPANTSLKIDGKTYRFNAEGWMVTGWSQVEHEWRYYDRSGAMRTGWTKVKGKWYYLDPADGKMETGWQEVANTWYYLDLKNGDMKTGWIKSGRDWYYADRSGARTIGWQKVKGTWYYLDPATAIMQTGWVTVDGKKYFLNSSGAMRGSGWFKNSNDWYWITGSGAVKTGWQKVKGTWYYLNPHDGKMLTGFYEVNGVTYYSNGSGAMKTGWVKIGSGWYYFEGSGALAKNRWISGKYWVGADGRWITDPAQTGTGSGGSTNAALEATIEANKKVGTIAQGTLRDTVFSLVSSAENSTIDFNAEYGYIEDIDDGRGYTCGIIGFTSATGDLLDVVELYVALAPDNNPLKPYVPALKAAVGSDTHAGLGSGFVSAWKKACKTSAMIEAQNAILNEQYMLPAVNTAQADSLSPLGQYIYYDALVVHGPGDDEDSFGGIRAAALKKAKTPAQGGSEATYLSAFLDARSKVMLKEEAHSDLSRINVQRAFIKEKKWDLSRPLSWTMYGDRFELK